MNETRKDGSAPSILSRRERRAAMRNAQALLALLEDDDIGLADKAENERLKKLLQEFVIDLLREGPKTSTRGGTR